MRTLIMFFCFFTALPAIAKVDGVLGPMRLQLDGIHESAGRSIQKPAREQASHFFTGNSDRVYRLDMKLSKVNVIKKKKRDKPPTPGTAIHDYELTMKLSLYRPTKEDMAAAVFPIRSVNQVIFEGNGNYYPSPSYNLPGFVSRRVSLFFKELDGQNISAELVELERDMSTPQEKPGAGITAFYAIGNGVIDVSKAVGRGVYGVAKVLGSPEVSAAISQQVSVAGSQLSAMDRENYVRSAEIQAIIYEAENKDKSELVKNLNRPSPSLASDSSVKERRHACVGSGGVFYEVQGMCWRQAGKNGSSYISDSMVSQQQAAVQRQQQQRAEAARQWNQQPGVSNQRESFSASSGAASTATKTECVARSESTGPKPNIPKQYCQYVFADYTDNVSFGLDDYSNEFMKESHSKESAKKALGFELLKKAKETCKAKGYSRVHHNETYEYNEVDVNVGQCKENNRMGSTFYLCGGTASFICARSD